MSGTQCTGKKKTSRCSGAISISWEEKFALRRNAENSLEINFFFCNCVCNDFDARLEYKRIHLFQVFCVWRRFDFCLSLVLSYRIFCFFVVQNYAR